MRPQAMAGCIAVAASALATTGCASVPADAGFSDVRAVVQEKTGQQLTWDPTEDTAALSADRVRDLLQGELTADRAVHVAFANNRDLRAELEELGLARADLVQASTIRNPLLDGEIRFPGSPSEPFELIVSKSLIDLIQLRSRRASGQASFDVARRAVTGVVLAFAGEVRIDYYTLQAARQLLARQQTATDAAELAADIARRQHEAGNITDLDLEREQALYEQAKLDLAESQLAALQATELLLADLGVTAATEVLNLTPALPAVPAAVEDPVAEDLDTIVASRLDVALAELQVQAAQRARPLAKGAIFEELEAGVHHEREPEGEATTGPSLVVPLPLFNRGRAQRLRAIGTLRQAEQRLLAVRVNASAETRAARERLREARARAEYLRDVVLPRRERILHLTHLEYNAMQRGVYDLIEARKELESSERAYVLAQRDYWVSRTQLESALAGVSSFAVRRDLPILERPQLSTEPQRQREMNESQ